MIHFGGHKTQGPPDDPSREGPSRPPKRPPGRGKRLILKSTAILPAMFTLGNAISGFACITLATNDALGESKFGDLWMAAWFIFIAMGCDMLDGRLARMTRRTSDFGAQLDSMADVVSFGLAPAVLMLRTVTKMLRSDTVQLGFLQHSPAVERVVWIFAAVYVACAAMRLARFNVENVPDESAHMNFKGLPSPGAAAAIAALVLLLVHLSPETSGWKASPILTATVSVLLAVITLIGGLMMVSTFPYPHVVNQYLRAKKPFNYLVRVVIIILAALVEVYITVAAVAVCYALAGPVRAYTLRKNKKPAPAISQATGNREQGTGNT